MTEAAVTSAIHRLRRDYRTSLRNLVRKRCETSRRWTTNCTICSKSSRNRQADTIRPSQLPCPRPVISPPAPAAGANSSPFPSTDSAPPVSFAARSKMILPRRNFPSSPFATSRGRGSAGLWPLRVARGAGSRRNGRRLSRARTAHRAGCCAEAGDSPPGRPGRISPPLPGRDESGGSLDHPHVLPVYEIGEYDGLPFFTMKLAEGGSLASQLDAGRAAFAMSPGWWRKWPAQSNTPTPAASCIAISNRRTSCSMQTTSPTSPIWSGEVDDGRRHHDRDFGCGRGARLPCAGTGTPAGGPSVGPGRGCVQHGRGALRTCHRATSV